MYTVGVVIGLFILLKLTKDKTDDDEEARRETKQIIFNFIFVIVECIFLVCDMYLILNGYALYIIPIDPRSPDPDQYILAVLKVYIDVVGIFTSLLALLGTSEAS